MVVHIKQVELEKWKKKTVCNNEVSIRQGSSVYLILWQRTCHVLVAAG